MPLQATSGAASYDAFGGGVPVEPVYIEQIFSTYLYTGTSATQTITNGIDLAGKGGLAWTKYRSGTNVAGHFLADSVRGISKTLQTNSEGGEQTTSYFTAFNSNGFSISSTTEINYLNTLYVSWTFRKQTKFFDIITYTGNGTSGTNIAHNLGSTPGCVMVKSTSTGRRWAVYHRGNGATPQNNFLNLNTTGASIASSVMWNNTAPTSTVFTLGSGTVVDAPTGEVTSTNENGVTYVAYIFAHNAGGFGLTGTDNVISCGSVVGASQVEVNLGYEPQWILVKNASAAQDWWVVDNMRGLPVQATDTSYNASALRPNLSDAETTGFSIAPSATGFKANVLTSGQTYIYIAIRRGPMKVPTDATKVFKPVLVNSSASNQSVDATFPSDLIINQFRNTAVGAYWFDRLRGLGTSSSPMIESDSTVAEGSNNYIFAGGQTTVTAGGVGSGYTIVDWFFRRAPSFFDEVCYTGDSTTPRSLNHNLAAVPELMILKKRSATGEWFIYSNFTSTSFKYANFNTSGFTSRLYTDVAEGLSSQPTSTALKLDDSGRTNGSGITYVVYLFATCAGVSKVGSYTGTATTKQIDCGFTGGARFVLIKKTSGTGSWYVWDSSRGIVSGNDPYLLLNSTAAEVTNTDYIDTYSAGFEISSTAPSEINENGGSFIFLAIS